jgi:hypothetical protein
LRSCSDGSRAHTRSDRGTLPRRRQLAPFPLTSSSPRGRRDSVRVANATPERDLRRPTQVYELADRSPRGYGRNLRRFPKVVVDGCRGAPRRGHGEPQPNEIASERWGHLVRPGRDDRPHAAGPRCG